MSSFDDREKAFERKFAHDAEMRFKAEARANRLLATWAGSLLGKEGEALAAYASEVIRSDMEEAGQEDVYRKLAADLDGKATEAEIRAQMAAALAKAKEEIAGQGA